MAIAKDDGSNFIARPRRRGAPSAALPRRRRVPFPRVAAARARAPRALALARPSKGRTEVAAAVRGRDLHDLFARLPGTLLPFLLDEDIALPLDDDVERRLCH